MTQVDLGMIVNFIDFKFVINTNILENNLFSKVIKLNKLKVINTNKKYAVVCWGTLGP